MGCYPLKEMMARILGKYKGKERRNASRRMVYSPPQTYTHRRSVAKSVNFSNNNHTIIIPPEPDPGPAHTKHYSEPAIPHSPQCPHGHNSSTRPEVSEPKEPKRARFALGPDVHENAHSGPIQHEPGPVYHGPAHHEPSQGYRGQVRPDPNQGYHGPIRQEPEPSYRGAVPYYAPSPLPKWEDRPRRPEYFSGEYCYYPTPIREGIYNIATDPYRLTNMFSEENPNACTIV